MVRDQNPRKNMKVPRAIKNRLGTSHVLAQGRGVSGQAQSFRWNGLNNKLESQSAM